MGQNPQKRSEAQPPNTEQFLQSGKKFKLPILYLAYRFVFTARQLIQLDDEEEGHNNAGCCGPDVVHLRQTLLHQ